MSHSLQLTDEIEAELIDSLGREAANQLLMIKDRLPELEAASSLRAACRRCAAEIPGLTEEALYCRMKRYKKTGNLLDLANRRGGSNLWSVQKRTLLPAAFKEFYRALREKHQRVATAAHDELVLIYRTRYDLEGKFYDRIPGFDGWPPANPLTGLPEGWTYKNLQKAVPDHPWDRAASRQGLAAASAFRPPVRTTRVGLRIGERVEFDDHQFDLKVHFAGQSRAMRPVCFGGVDGLSSFVSLAVRPTLWDDAAEQKRTLTEFQFRSFVLFWLSTHGYRDDDRGTTLVTERGTAVIREDFESRLRAFTGGRVKVSAGSMFSEASHQLNRVMGAGNTIVLKPSELTPYSAFAIALLGEEAGLPPGWLNVVTCPGSVADRLVTHDDVAMITFTGSPEVGWGIRARGARKRVSLELGNNAPVVVEADADLELAATKIVAAVK